MWPCGLPSSRMTDLEPSCLSGGKFQGSAPLPLRAGGHGDTTCLSQNVQPGLPRSPGRLASTTVLKLTSVTSAGAGAGGGRSPLTFGAKPFPSSSLTKSNDVSSAFPHFHVRKWWAHDQARTTELAEGPGCRHRALCPVHRTPWHKLTAGPLGLGIQG